MFAMTAREGDPCTREAGYAAHQKIESRGKHAGLERERVLLGRLAGEITDGDGCIQTGHDREPMEAAAFITFCCLGNRFAMVHVMCHAYASPVVPP